MNKLKTVLSLDDCIKQNIHVGETVIYNNKYYTFEGISGYTCDNNRLIDRLTEIKNIDFGDPYIGKRFIYHGYTIEVLQQNKNGTYSIQAYDEKGKKHGGKFAVLKQDLQKAEQVA